MIIPNAENADVDIRKLYHYSLNTTHRVGGDKARLFIAKLGIEQKDANELRHTLLEIVRSHDADIRELDEHGQRYRIDFTLTWRNKQALVRSGWIIRTNEHHPRLVTCYPI